MEGKDLFESNKKVNDYLKNQIEKTNEIGKEELFNQVYDNITSLIDDKWSIRRVGLTILLAGKDGSDIDAMYADVVTRIRGVYRSLGLDFGILTYRVIKLVRQNAITIEW